jgi:hypothetical protein
MRPIALTPSNSDSRSNRGSCASSTGGSPPPSAEGAEEKTRGEAALGGELRAIRELRAAVRHQQKRVAALAEAVVAAQEDLARLRLQHCAEAADNERLADAMLSRLAAIQAAQAAEAAREATSDARPVIDQSTGISSDEHGGASSDSDDGDGRCAAGRRPSSPLRRLRAQHRAERHAMLDAIAGERRARDALHEVELEAAAAALACARAEMRHVEGADGADEPGGGVDGARRALPSPPAIWEGDGALLRPSADDVARAGADGSSGGGGGDGAAESVTSTDELEGVAERADDEAAAALCRAGANRRLPRATRLDALDVAVDAAVEAAIAERMRDERARASKELQSARDAADAARSAQAAQAEREQAARVEADVQGQRELVQARMLLAGGLLGRLAIESAEHAPPSASPAHPTKQASACILGRPARRY